MAPTLSEVLYGCEWKNQRKNCSLLFSTILTDEGYCFTFNFLNSSEVFNENNLSPDYPVPSANNASKHWNAKYDYGKGLHQSDEYPLRVFGASDGLFVHLRAYDKDMDNLCRYAVQGYKLLLHTSGEIPQISKYFYRIPLNHEVILSVKPILMTTSDTLGHYRPERRKCFLETERQLLFFKVYSQRNCELECATNNTLNRCGCVSFEMPSNIYMDIIKGCRTIGRTPLSRLSSGLMSLGQMSH